MKIYDTAIGPYPARVRIAIIELTLQSHVQFVNVSLRKGQHKTADFISKNYSGTLPVLELADGTLIAECTAITEYLDFLNGSPILTGKTCLQKGLIHMMSRRAELELLDEISFYFHHATPGLGPDVEKYQNADWGFHQRDKAIRGMKYFDDVLKKKKYIATDFFSLAYITLIGGLIFADLVKLPIPQECSALRDWYSKMSNRPSVVHRLSLSQ
jgi:glutathione S-transferase